VSRAAGRRRQCPTAQHGLDCVTAMNTTRPRIGSARISTQRTGWAGSHKLSARTSSSCVAAAVTGLLTILGGARATPGAPPARDARPRPAGRLVLLPDSCIVAEYILKCNVYDVAIAHWWIGLFCAISRPLPVPTTESYASQRPGIGCQTNYLGHNHPSIGYRCVRGCTRSVERVAAPLAAPRGPPPPRPQGGRPSTHRAGMPLDPGAALRGALLFRGPRRARDGAAADGGASAREGAADCSTLRALASSATSAAAADVAARRDAAARPSGGWSVRRHDGWDGGRDVDVHAFARRGETAGEPSTGRARAGGAGRRARASPHRCARRGSPVQPLARLWGRAGQGPGLASPGMFPHVCSCGHAG
jgi:hypothetical protein